jgi:hypothetical protein
MELINSNPSGVIDHAATIAPGRRRLSLGIARRSGSGSNQARNRPASCVQHMGDHDIALGRFIFDRAGLRSVMLVSRSFIADAMVTIG